MARRDDIVAKLRAALPAAQRISEMLSVGYTSYLEAVKDLPPTPADRCFDFARVPGRPSACVLRTSADGSRNRAAVATAQRYRDRRGSQECSVELADLREDGPVVLAPWEVMREARSASTLATRARSYMRALKVERCVLTTWPMVPDRSRARSRVDTNVIPALSRAAAVSAQP